MHRFAAFLLVLLALGLSSCQTPVAVSSSGPVILVSIDGFRWDYLEKDDVPTLRALAADGVHARRLTPAFPSRTFPNHYTIVTGLRPEHHGIVNNGFYDPVQQAFFGKADHATAWWDGGEPVWVTAGKQGLPTACYFWPGSEAEIRGHRPTFYQKFSNRVPPNDRVDQVLKWLALPASQRPRFIALYFDSVDIAGHTFGPDAAETAAAAHAVDTALARLQAGLAALNLAQSANLVVVSDHGMSAISPDQVVFYDDLMDMTQVTVEANGPHGGVRPKPGVDVDALVASIRAKAPPQLQVYRREKLPPHLHYNSGDRVPPIIFVLADHWCIEQKTGWPAFRAVYNKGNHGWDPAFPNMGALFIAHGPAFKRGATLDAVENIHLYNLLCATLGLKPAPNDGDDTLVRAALAR